MVTEVGRQPWIVYNLMKVEDAATANTGVWVTFVAVVLLYVALGRHDDRGAALDEPAVPARRRVRRPGRAVRACRRRRDAAETAEAGAVSTVVAVVLLLALAAYAVFGGADFGAGLWDLVAGGPDQGASAARTHRAVDRSGLGGQPRLADLHLRRDLDGVPVGVPVDHADDVRPADHRGPRHRAARRELRVPQGGRGRCASGAIFGGGFALSSVLVPFCMGAVAGGIASGQVPSGGQAGDPVDSWLNLTSVVTGVLAVAVAAYLAAVYLVWDARRRRTTTAAGRVLPSPRHRGGRRRGGARRRRPGRRALPKAPARLRRPDVARPADRHRSASSCGIGALVLLLRDAARGARLLAVVAVAGIIARLGSGAVAVPAARRASRSRPRQRPAGTLTALVVAVVPGAADRAARVRPAVRARPAPAAARRGRRGRRRPCRSSRPRLSGDAIICGG